MDTSSQHADGQLRLKSRSLSLLAQFNGRRDYLVGIFLLIVVVFLWTASNFVTQDLFDDGYDKPFLITYLNTSSFTLYLFPYLFRRSFNSLRGNEGGHHHDRTYQPLPTDVQAAEALGSNGLATQADHQVHHNEDGIDPLTVHEIAKLAAWFCLLWFIANWSLNAGLGYTSVASATILSSMSGFFTLALGRLFRVETLTIVKICAVLASFGGVVLVSLSDSQHGGPQPVDQSSIEPRDSFTPAPVIGDSLALLSALFYALYVILLKVRVRSEARIDMQLFFGFVGLFNVLFCWPIGVILHLARVERFEVPTSSRAIVGVLINMALTLSSDYLYVLAMLKTTPLVATVGLSLTMPLAVIGDFFLHKPATIQIIFGAVIVLLSFVAVGLDDAHNEEEDDLIAGRPLDEEAPINAVHLEDDVHLEAHAIDHPP